MQICCLCQASRRIRKQKSGNPRNVLIYVQRAGVWQKVWKGGSLAQDSDKYDVDDVDDNVDEDESTDADT